MSRDLRQEMFNLRLQQASAQLEKPARLRTSAQGHRARRNPHLATAQQSGITDFVWLKQPTNVKTERGNRKERVGEVISNKMTKTIVVRVERRFPHPQLQEGRHRLQEILRARRKERGQGRRPRAHSRKPARCPRPKRWRLVEVVERSSGSCAGGGLDLRDLCCKFVPFWMWPTTPAPRSRCGHRRARPQPALCRHRRRHQGAHQGSRAGRHGEKGRSAWTRWSCARGRSSAATTARICALTAMPFVIIDKEHEPARHAHFRAGGARIARQEVHEDRLARAGSDLKIMMKISC